MPLTKDFKETVRARLLRSAGFRRAVLQEAIDGLLAGDVDTAKALLRDYINGTMWARRSESDPFATRKVIHLEA